MRPIDAYALTMAFVKKRKRKLKLDDILYEIEKAPSIKDGLLITIDGKTGYFPKEFRVAEHRNAHR